MLVKTRPLPTYVITTLHYDHLKKISYTFFIFTLNFERKIKEVYVYFVYFAKHHDAYKKWVQCLWISQLMIGIVTELKPQDKYNMRASSWK